MNNKTRITPDRDARPIKIAIVQSGPVYLDVAGSMDRAETYVKKAAAKNAKIIVFGETWLSGYPVWLDLCPRAACWNYRPTKEVFQRICENGVFVPGPETRVLCNMARENGIVICMGMNERSRTGTVYNSFIIVDKNGRIVNHHRKLMPTHTERLVYGLGDGHGLRAVETSVGRIGALICWEHWMPMARQVMHDSGEQIHVALWPSVGENHQLASRHYAFEGRCYVIAAGQLMRGREIPKGLKLPRRLAAGPKAMVMYGGSAVIGPDGRYVLEPRYNRPDLVITEIPGLARIAGEKMTLDVSGHYSRPDIFSYKICRKRR